MPAGDSARVTLVETSVDVARVAADHEHHQATRAALTDRRLGLAGHAAFECFSVLTRRPAPARRTRATVGRLLAADFPETRFLPAPAAAQLLERLDTLGIAGGAGYDALVGAAALAHGLVLATRDRRALSTYRTLEVRIELI